MPRGNSGLCLSSAEGRAPWTRVAFLCLAQLVCAHRTVLAGPKGCSAPCSWLCYCVTGPDITGRYKNLVLIQAFPRAPHRAGLFLCNSILTAKQSLLQVPLSFSKHLQAFSFPDGGQSCGRGLWAGASCKSISLTSRLLKKLDIRALTTANLLLSLPPEKWIILMLTEGFSFFKPCQI